VVIHPVPAQVQARPEVVIHPMPLPVGPWVRIEPHLPLAQAKRVQAKPGATILPAPAQVQAQPKVAIHPVPVQVQARPEVAIHPVPAQVQARPEVATHPAPAQVQAQPEVVIRTVPLTAGPWTQIEPHLPLPRAHRNQSVSRIPAGEPPARVQAPPKVAALPPPAPVPPPGLGARASLQPSLGPIPPPRPAAPILPPPRPAPVQPQPPAPPAAAVPQPGPTPSEPAQPGEASRDWPGAGEALNLLRGPKGRRWICVTFDGGSTAEVAEDVLNVLKEHGIRTTLFLTGDFIRKYPDLVRRMARDGHELGNHTMNHPHFAPHMKRDPQWTRERFQKELLDADRAFYQLLGRPMDPYWRAPYGEQTAELRRWAEELGYRHVGWSEGADSLDWATVKEFNLYRSGSAIIERLEKRLRKDDGDGLIVLMHLGSLRPALDRPAKYLGPFMDWALQDGWHFVAIGDYLKAMGRPAWEPSRRVARINQGAGPDSP
jgi:peptidoglycan/xylan/chitin deacetylase (PgdA/CDA1 family)